MDRREQAQNYLNEGLPVETYTWLHNLGVRVRRYIRDHKEIIQGVEGGNMPPWCQMHAFVTEAFLVATGTPNVRICYEDSPFHFYVGVCLEDEKQGAILDCFPVGAGRENGRDKVNVCSASTRNGVLSTLYSKWKILEDNGAVSRDIYADLIRNIQEAMTQCTPDLTDLTTTNPYTRASQQS